MNAPEVLTDSLSRYETVAGHVGEFFLLTLVLYAIG